MKFYINVVQTWGSRDLIWQPIWMPEYFGADQRHKAVELRRKALAYLQSCTKRWKRKHFRTIKVELA